MVNWSTGLEQASADNFGKPHNGRVDFESFLKDFDAKYTRSQRSTQTMSEELQAKLRGVRPWKPSEESIESYVKKCHASPEADAYMLQIVNHIDKTARGAKISNDANLNNLMDNFMNDMMGGINEIEARAEKDTKLSETEVFSILAVTCTVRGTMKAVSASAQMFFVNLTSSLNRNLETRCWLCRLFNTVVNVVATVVSSAATFVWQTAVFLYNVVDALIFDGGGWNAVANHLDVWAQNVGSFARGTLGWIGGDYTCFLNDDLWNCPG